MNKSSYLLLTLLTVTGVQAQPLPDWNPIGPRPQVIVHRDPRPEECQRFVGSVLSRREQNINQGSICFIPQSRDSILGNKANFTKCVEKALQLNLSGQNFLEVCSEDSTRNALLTDTQLAACLQNPMSAQLGAQQVQGCLDPQTRTALQTPAYTNCLKIHKEIRPHMNGMTECHKPEVSQEMNAPELNTCIGRIQTLNINLRSSVSYCRNTAKQTDSHWQELEQCRAQTVNLVGATIAGYYCMVTRHNLSSFTANSSRCMQQLITRHLDPTFFSSEEQSQSAMQVFDNMFDQCQQPQAPAPRDSTLKFLNVQVFSANAAVNGNKVGGLSGLSYDEATQTVLAVSDDPGMRGPSRFFRMSFDPRLSRLNFQSASNLTMVDGGGLFRRRRTTRIQLDAEGIVHLPDNRIVISTESLGGTSFLRIFDRNGRETEEIAVDDKFLPTEEEVEAPAQQVQVQQIQPQMQPRVQPQVLQPVQQWSPYQNNTQYGPQDNRQSGSQFGPAPMQNNFRPAPVFTLSGIQDNKSFESLGATRDGQTLFTANEAPLHQDLMRDKKIIRLVKMSRDGHSFSQRAEYAYELSSERDNGLVDLIVLTPDKVLTLERAFDPGTNKVTSRIFEVSLTGARDYTNVRSFADEAESGQIIQTVSKRLLMDLDEVIPFMPRGLNRIDNLEGMTLGPRLANGKHLLILVADNNFSSRQQNQFIMLELNATALGLR